MHLYVSPSHVNQGIGRKLIQFAVDRTTERKLKRLIALTTQAFAYFKSKASFDEGALKDLPPTRREEYERNGRNSKILIKYLTL
jgi:amino-acid N-acetyltransferase